MDKKEYHGITVNDLYNALYRKVNCLVDEILNYESDTFSSEASEITSSEAEKVALAFIVRDIENRTNMDTMDGTMIDSELYELRQPVEAN